MHAHNHPATILRHLWMLITLLMFAGCGVPHQEAAAPLPTARIALITTPSVSPTRTPTATTTTSPTPVRPTSVPTRSPIPSPNYVPTRAILTEVPAQALSDDEARDADTVEMQIFAKINQLRVENSLPPLAYNPILGAAARAHSCDMAVHHAINHTSSDGRNLVQRLPRSTPLWEWPSENIAAGFGDAEAVVHAWFDESPPDDWHRRNILTTEQRELGIGYCYDAGGGSGNDHFYTADFARRTNLFPLVVANGATTTTTRQVPFWLYGNGWADAVRLGSTPDLSSLPWQPFAPSGSYELLPISGPQIVYAELRGPGGVTEIVSATVTLQ